jgi:hypothetical protein
MPVQALPPDQILQRLAKLFMTPAHDRHVYCVFGQYARLRPFQKRMQEAVAHGDFNSLGLVEYLSLNAAVPEHMRTLSTFEKAQQLARDRHDDEFRKLLSQALRDLVTRKIEASNAVGLILADFELLYSYDLGDNDLSIVRQVAINGKRVCLLVPGTMRDGRLWVFDEDEQSRRELPPAMVFQNSGWVFALPEETK